MISKGIKKYSSAFFFLLGLILLGLMIHKFGFVQLYDQVKSLKYKLLIVLIFPLTWNIVQTLGWYFILEETGAHASFWDLFKIRATGDAINTLTPVGFMGGDPFRIYYLRNKMSGALSTASVVLDRTMQFLATTLFFLVGLIDAWAVLSLPQSWRYSFPAFIFILLGGTWYFIHHQKKGLFDLISRFLRRLGFKKHLSETIKSKMDLIDQRIASFYRHDHKRFFLVLGFHFLGRVFGMFEIYIIAHLLLIPLSMSGALFLATLTALINTAFVFIPGTMGVMEGAYSILFQLLNLNPFSGVVVQLLRRLRTVFWVLLGLFFMLRYPKDKRLKAPAL